MQQVKDQLLLRKEDYEIIMGYLKKGIGRSTFTKQNAEELEAELLKAKLVSDEELPGDVVRLNSFVTIRDEQAKKTMEVKVVTPEKADIKQKMISVLSPVGTALIGFRKGQQVSWRVPAGEKTFSILEVTNTFQ